MKSQDLWQIHCNSDASYVVFRILVIIAAFCILLSTFYDLVKNHCLPTTARCVETGASSEEQTTKDSLGEKQRSGVEPKEDTKIYKKGEELIYFCK